MNTYTTNAGMVATSLARTMTKANGGDPDTDAPTVSEGEENDATFSVDSPFGRVTVSVSIDPEGADL